MPVTVGVNQLSVVHKASNGLVIAFPDVCKVPAPPTGMVPIPYPNVAKTAAAKTATKRKAGGVTKVGGLERKKVMQMAGATSHNAEKQQLRSRLAALNAKLQNMNSKDPAQWQAVLQDYAVTASALYVVLNAD